MIERLEVTNVWGGDPIVKVTDQLRITPDGIYYLRDNSTMRKLAQLLPQAAAIASLFAEIKMSRKRLGRQKPTQSYILRYKTSRGPEAVDLCFAKG